MLSNTVFVFIPILLLSGCNRKFDLNGYENLDKERNITTVEVKASQRSFSKKYLLESKIKDVFFNDEDFFILTNEKLFNFSRLGEKLAEYKCSAYEKVFSSNGRIILARVGICDLFEIKDNKLIFVNSIAIKEGLFRVFFSNSTKDQKIILVMKNGNVYWFSRNGHLLKEFKLNLRFSISECDLYKENVFITNQNFLYTLKDGELLGLNQLNELGDGSGVFYDPQETLNRLCVFGNDCIFISDIGLSKFRKYRIKKMYRPYLFKDELLKTKADVNKRSLVIKCDDCFLISNLDKVYNTASFDKIKCSKDEVILGVVGGQTISIKKGIIYCCGINIFDSPVKFASMNGNLLICESSGRIHLYDFDKR